MHTLPTCRWFARLLLALAFGLALLPGVPAAQGAAPGDSAPPAASADTSERLHAAAIKARIAVVQARTDIPMSQRDLVVKQLQVTVARLAAAAVARKAAGDYAAALQSAPTTLAALNQQSLPGAGKPAPVDANAEPIRLQLDLASLQTRAASLRSQQRDLEESLRSMTRRPEEARAELADLNSQLDQPQAAIPANASPLQVEAATCSTRPRDRNFPRASTAPSRN